MNDQLELYRITKIDQVNKELIEENTNLLRMIQKYEQKMKKLTKSNNLEQNKNVNNKEKALAEQIDTFRLKIEKAETLNSKLTSRLVK